MKHLIIPDTQVKPGVPLDHFEWIGNYICEKRPDVIVHLGDHFDLPSLCDYDEDVAEVSQRRLKTDIAAGQNAFDNLIMRFSRIKGYRPRLEYCLGNHEERFNRLMARTPKLRGLVPAPWHRPQQQGWRVHSYLKPVVIDGIAYCHQFVKSSNGRVVSTKWGASNARVQVMREMRSCTAGHKPGVDLHIQPAGNRSLYGLIVGSAYLHSEEWMSPQGDRYWRGIVVKHEVANGEYDPMFVSLKYLKRRYS